jgi:hypothetical protein
MLVRFRSTSSVTEEPMLVRLRRQRSCSLWSAPGSLTCRSFVRCRFRPGRSSIGASTPPPPLVFFFAIAERGDEKGNCIVGSSGRD